MYYLKFITEEGDEHNISCYSYSVAPRDGWSFVTTNHRDSNGHYESNFCIGGGDPNKLYISMFAMNINGQTIDKIITKNQPQLTS